MPSWLEEEPSRRQEMKVSSLFQNVVKYYQWESCRATAPGTRRAVARGSFAAACVRVSLSCLAPLGARPASPFFLCRHAWLAAWLGLPEGIRAPRVCISSPESGALCVVGVCKHTQHRSLIILWGTRAGANEVEGDAAGVGARCGRLARHAACR